MKLLVHIVTYGRLSLLKRCYRSVMQALPLSATVSILLNGEDPETRSWLNSLSDPRTIWSEVPAESLSAARNRAFDVSDVDIIHFLDDDVIVPAHLFHEAVARFEEEADLAVLGGPNLSPPESSSRQRLFGAIMTSVFAAPKVRLRYGSESSKAPERTGDSSNLIFCNLAVVPGRLPQSVNFDTRLRSNQETLFLYTCETKKIRRLFSPSLYVYHHRRETLFLFLKQILSYGVGRGQQTVLAPRSCGLLFLAPPLAIIIGAFLAAHSFPTLLFLILFHAALGSLSLLSSATLRALPIPLAMQVPLLVALVHGCYGIGFWQGVLLQLVAVTSRWCRSFSSNDILDARILEQTPANQS